MDNTPITYPKILSMNPKELIEWCNKRKKEMHLSNAKLAAATNVPEGTLDRILTGKNPEFRYTTIQPVITFLIGFNEDTPTNQSNDYYADTIDGYKLIVENKNTIIERLKQEYAKLQSENDYLKKQNDEKQKVVEDLLQQNKWLQGTFDKMASEFDK